ncbi:MAG: hypothetical protein CMI55_04785 [Parcubacteria group bacterium]|nr:hypothetical protein [Parcubacteria group bacterium]
MVTDEDTLYLLKIESLSAVMLLTPVVFWNTERKLSTGIYEEVVLFHAQNQYFPDYRFSVALYDENICSSDKAFAGHLIVSMSVVKFHNP